MKCQKCGMPIPEDSEFCQYCGAPIEERENSENQIRIAMDSSKESPITVSAVEGYEGIEDQSIKKSAGKQKYCKRCGGLINPDTHLCTKCGVRHFSMPRIPSWIFGVLLVLALGACAFLGYQLNESNNTITNLTRRANHQSDVISNKNDKIEELEDSYNEIVNALSSDNLGYGASNFKVSEGIVVVHLNETNKKITLTANWPNGGTVEYRASSGIYSAADISLDNNEWTTSTTISITPKHVGAVTYSFTNNVDSITFDVAIIVIE